MTEPRDEIVVRPSPRSLRPAAARVATLAWAASVAAVALTREDGDGVVIGCVALAAALAAFLLVRRFKQRARLVFDGRRLIFTGVCGARVIAEVPASGRVVTATIAGRGDHRRRRLLLDGSGRAALGLDAGDWDVSALDDLAGRAGYEPFVDPEPRSPAELREAYPGALPWVMAHPLPFTFALIVGVGILQQTVSALL